MPEDITSDALAGGAEFTPADGSEAASQAVELKDVINQALGKDFKTSDEALKAVTDTFKYVGKAGKYEKAVKAVQERLGVTEDEAVASILGTNPGKAAPEKAVDASDELRSEVSQLKEARFFDKHPELEPYQDLVKTFAKGKGVTLDEAVKDESFKGLIDSKVELDKTRESRNVLVSNPRLSAARNEMKEAVDLAQSGNQVAAADKAVSAVLNAFDIS